MTLMQRLSVWMAKRYLKAHHYRIKGFAGDTVLACGDALISPGGKRIFAEYNRATLEGRAAELRLDKIPGKCHFIGVDPPKLKLPQPAKQ